MSCNKSNKHKGWLALAALLILAFFLFCIFKVTLAGMAAQAERLSAFIAVIDDLLVRILGTVLLGIAAIGMVSKEGRRALLGSDDCREPASAIKANTNNENEDAALNQDAFVEKAGSGSEGGGAAFLFKERSFVLLKFAALLAASGLSFFQAYTLDEKDGGDFKLLTSTVESTVISPQVVPVVLARWAQVAPSIGSECILPSSQAVVRGGAPAACPYNFLVRAVVPVAQMNCPDVTVAYADGTRAVSMVERNNPYQAGFSQIRVCEARLKGTDRPLSAVLSGEAPIPLTGRWSANGGPVTVAIIGDTGCRASNKQTCNEDQWPFANVVGDLAPTPALATTDLVVHMGDFMYVKFDAWDVWKAEFFDVASPLLASAPWLMVRGNHERCGKFGDAPLGFYLFFDVGDETLNCKDGQEANDGQLTETYAVDLSSDRRIIVSDSATAFTNNTDNPSKDNESYGQMLAMLEGGRSLSDGVKEKSVWFATHVPVYALEKCDGTTCSSDPASATMRAAWYASGKTPPRVDAILSGHAHLFEVLKAPDQPLQVVSGAGGVELDPPPSALVNSARCVDAKSLASTQSPSVTLPTYAAANAQVDLKACSNTSFGYVMAVKNDFSFVPVP